jgi:hypothetical protein
VDNNVSTSSTYAMYITNNIHYWIVAMKCMVVVVCGVWYGKREKIDEICTTFPSAGRALANDIVGGRAIE